MSDSGQQAAGWYYAQGDPPGTQRYWDGAQWQGGPQPVAGAAGAGFASGAAGGAAAALSSPGKRMSARLIDGLIGVVIAFFVAIILGIGLGSRQFGFNSRQWFATVILTLIFVAYETWFVMNRGATPGKMALGMKVIRQDGAPMEYAVAAKRIALYALGIIPFLGDFAVLVIGVVSLVLLFSDQARQTVWDKFAGTVVVDT